MASFTPAGGYELVTVGDKLGRGVLPQKWRAREALFAAAGLPNEDEHPHAPGVFAGALNRASQGGGGRWQPDARGVRGQPKSGTATMRHGKTKAPDRFWS